MFLFFFGNITYRHAIGEREIKYHFISRRTIVRRAIKLTLFPGDVELISKRQNHDGPYYMFPSIRVVIENEILVSKNSPRGRAILSRFKWRNDTMECRVIKTPSKQNKSDDEKNTMKERGKTKQTKFLHGTIVVERRELLLL